MTETMSFLYHLIAEGRGVNPTRFSVLINDWQFGYPKSAKRKIAINLIRDANGMQSVNRHNLDGDSITILSKLVPNLIHEVN